MTGYLVLQQTDTGWREVGRVTARDDKHAIQQATTDLDDRDGTYVAVPERSFKPRTLQVEIVERSVWQ